MAWMRLVFVVMSCSRLERPLRVPSMARLRTPPKRPPPARLDSGRLHVGCTPHVAGRGTLRCREWWRESRESRESRANAAATPTRAGKRGAVVRSVVGERRSSGKQAGRLRYDPQCGGDPSGAIREPAVPFSCEGSSTGAAEYALALEADWCRNAYGARQSVDLHEVTRSSENPMRTITSMLCTRDGARLALRTSRPDAAVCELLPIGLPGQFAVSTQEEHDDRTGGTKGRTYSRCQTVDTAPPPSTEPISVQQTRSSNC